MGRKTTAGAFAQVVGRILITSVLMGALGLLQACGGGGPRGSNQEPDPVVDDVPIAYIVRTLPEADSETDSFLDLDRFHPGAKLYLRSRAAPRAQQIEIAADLFAENELYDVRDLDVSYDGTRLVFALRGPYLTELEEGQEQPETLWNLYEYDIPSATLRPLMPEDMAARGHDIAPTYLPDGRILFSSTRQHRTRAVMLDEGKPQYAYQNEEESGDLAGDTFVLHTLELDENRNPVAIEQVTFNQSHDFDPTVLSNGKVLFSRWDNYGDINKISLYQMNPDGSGLELLYGHDSHETGHGRELPTCAEVADLIQQQEQAIAAAEQAAQEAIDAGLEPEPIPTFDPIECIEPPADDAGGDGATDDGTADDGATDDGAADVGTTDDGAADDGAADDGTADDGTADTGQPEIEPTPVHFTQTRQMPDGRLVSILRSINSRDYEVELVAINSEEFVEYNYPLRASTSTQTGQENYTSFVVNSDGSFTANGRFSAVYPLYDGTHRAIVSWAPCRLEILSSQAAQTDQQDQPQTDDTTDQPQADDQTAQDDSQPQGKISTCVGRNMNRPDVQSAEADLMFGLWMFDLDSQTQTPILIPDESKKLYFSEVVVAQERPFPEVIPNTTIATETSDPNCRPLLFEEDDAYGIVNIRDIFDRDGAAFDWLAEKKTLDLLDGSSPVNGAADEHLFVRFEKAVPMPAATVLPVPGLALGESQQGMREILGYARVEPDGSVLAKVPADVPFMVSIVDSDGRRLNRDRHQNWLQLRPGEELKCHGCHDPDAETPVPHGRLEALPDSLNLGSETGDLFPDTSPEAYEIEARDGSDDVVTCMPDISETMAELRARLHPENITISPNLIYVDDWNPANDGSAETLVNRNYNTLATPKPYNSPACEENWDAFCRIVINYETHIQALWDRPRPQLDSEGNPIMVNGEPLDYQCSGCHVTSADPLNDNLPEQLDLTATRQQDTRFTSYHELLGSQFIQYLDDNGLLTDLFPAIGDDGGLLADIQKIAGVYQYDFQGAFRDIVIEEFLVDDNGDPILDSDGDLIPLTFHILESEVFDTRRLSPSMALDSYSTFYKVFRPSNVHGLSFDHSQDGVITDDELRMLWEWLDIGWQYYNNPFDIQLDLD